MLDDEIGDPGDEREQREAGERFGPGRQVGEKGKSVEDCEAFGRELAHGVVPAGKRVLSPVAVSGADRVTIATAPVKSWVPASVEPPSQPRLVEHLAFGGGVADRTRVGEGKSGAERG